MPAPVQQQQKSRICGEDESATNKRPARPKPVQKGIPSLPLSVGLRPSVLSVPVSDRWFDSVGDARASDSSL